jgi:fumarate hydratase class II
VNPVIPESVRQVCAQVMGNDTAIMVSGNADNFELAVMIPVMTYNLLKSIEILANVSHVFVDKCIAGIEANREKCRAYAERSPALATALAPIIGYDKAAEIAKLALVKDMTIRDLVIAEGLMDAKQADEVLDPAKQV